MVEGELMRNRTYLKQLRNIAARGSIIGNTSTCETDYNQYFRDTSVEVDHRSVGEFNALSSGDPPGSGHSEMLRR